LERLRRAAPTDGAAVQVDVERPAVVGVGQCDGEAAVGTDNALAALTGLAGSDCVVVQDGQRLAGIGGGAVNERVVGLRRVEAHDGTFE